MDQHSRYLQERTRRGRASIAAWIGPLVMLFICGIAISQYGRRWEFGPWGLPRSALTADGAHFRDGTPADPLTLTLVHSGWEQTLYFVALVVSGGLMTFAILLQLDTERKRRQLQAVLQAQRARQRQEGNDFCS